MSLKHLQCTGTLYLIILLTGDRDCVSISGCKCLAQENIKLTAVIPTKVEPWTV